MTYHRTIIQQIENYKDKNERAKTHSRAPKPLSLPFPFLEMSPGTFFDMTCPCEKEMSLRTMLHQNARVAGIWIRIFVHGRTKSETTLRVIHDGIRK